MPFRDSFALYQCSLIGTYFTGAIFSASKARAVRWYVYHKRRATQLAGKIVRPFGWIIAAHRVRCAACPIRKYRAAHRACPMGRYDP